MGDADGPCTGAGAGRCHFKSGQLTRSGSDDAISICDAVSSPSVAYQSLSIGHISYYSVFVLPTVATAPENVLVLERF